MSIAAGYGDKDAIIESLRQRVAELEGAPDILVQNAALTGENMILSRKLADEKLCHEETLEQLSTCEKERDEANSYVTRNVALHNLLAASQQRINELTDKNQNLFNALMNSTAYSDKLNEQIKRARGHMNLYRLFSCEGGDSYDPECAEKNLDKGAEILSETCTNDTSAVDALHARINELETYAREESVRTALMDKLMNRISHLECVCRDAYEVYAGSEGIPTPETAAEAYVGYLLSSMKDEIARGLK